MCELNVGASQHTIGYEIPCQTTGDAGWRTALGCDDMGGKYESNQALVMVVLNKTRPRTELTLLLSRTYRVEAFIDFADAWPKMLDEPPAIVLTDLDTVDLRGENHIATKHKDRNLCDIPFVVLGEEPAHDCAPDIEVEDDIYLQQPITSRQLFNCLGENMNQAIEKSWEKLPPLQSAALRDTVAQFQDISRAIETGAPLDMAESKKSCEPLLESVTAKQYRGILDNIQGHHNYTYVHSVRVATFLSVFGDAIGMKGDDLMTLTTGGLLHDVGKMATPPDILNKKGKLNDEEWGVMVGHVNHSKTVLERTPDVTKGITIIAEQHHEKLDGSGYPLGLKGAQLNDLARMSTIVDIFGALTDERSYKPAMEADRAFEILQDMGPKLDQPLVRVFRDVLSAL